ncbi:MAG: class I SAM-dependent methyltransferase [Methanogenium sp.]|jgi:SAM-dependent methyltransferase
MEPKEFWKKQKKYPEYGTIKERRLYELNYLVPRLKNTKTILDLGCGDGSLIRCLMELTKIERYYAYDISKNLLRFVPNNTVKKEYDIYSLRNLPKTDVTLMTGVSYCIFEDEVIEKFLKKINSDVLYIRDPLTLKNKRENVRTYSKKLKSNYAACYRTIPEFIDLLKDWKVTEICRIYPDQIESEFETKQFYFKCLKRNE